MHHQAPHGDSETSHALVQKEEPDPYQDGEEICRRLDRTQS